VLERVVRAQASAGDDEIVKKHLNACENCQQQFDHLFNEPAKFSAFRSAFRENCQVDLETLQAMCTPSLTTWEVRKDGVELSGGLRLALPRDSRFVARLDGYDVQGILGRGGMGVVLKGIDQDLQRDVALKVIKPSLVDDPAARGRFIREARTAAKLQHSNIVTIYSVKLDHVPPFLVMEYVSGMSMASLIETQSPLAPARAVELMLQLLSALAHAHGEGIIHRDVKPGNVLIDQRNGQAKLADFGLARGLIEGSRYTRDGTVMGTSWYMSPEQAAGSSDLDGRSDLFSAGVVLFEMLTGCRPFPGKNQYQVVSDIREKSAPDPRELNPSIPVALASIIMRALRKKPADRYPSAGEFIGALQKFLDSRLKRDENTQSWHRENGQATLQPADAGGVSEDGAAKSPAEIDNIVKALFRVTCPQPAFRARVWTEPSKSYTTRDLQTVARRDSGSYCIGDKFALNVQVEKDCYLTLLDRGTSGKVCVLVQNHPVKAGKPLSLAGPDSDREWVVGEPEGVEQLKAFFTVKPLCLFPGSGSLAVLPSPVQTRDINTRIKDTSSTLDQMPADSWTDALCEFTVSRS
jgi:serine/threonine protein kinase